MLVLSDDDFLWFVDAALGAMAAIVESLGDELANRRPDLPGANSPVAIVTHCLGVLEWWGGAVVAGRPVVRDRAAEFAAAGPVAPLVARMAEARAALALDLAGADPAGTPPGPVSGGDAALPLARTQSGAMLHLYEELAQHLGQLELTRDLLSAGG
jgi:hypothetical protein